MSADAFDEEPNSSRPVGVWQHREAAQRHHQGAAQQGGAAQDAGERCQEPTGTVIYVSASAKHLSYDATETVSNLCISPSFLFVDSADYYVDLMCEWNRQTCTSIATVDSNRNLHTTIAHHYRLKVSR